MGIYVFFLFLSKSKMAQEYKADLEKKTLIYVAWTRKLKEFQIGCGQLSLQSMWTMLFFRN